MADEQTCPSCNALSAADANWCEACGGDLDADAPAPKNPCVSCQAIAAEITDDDYCQVCGTKQPAPEDHVVADHGWFAIVSDRGRVHRTNEDAGAVAARTTGVALVVCDGVSSTDASQDASQNAARTIISEIEAIDATTFDTAIVSAAEAAQTEIVNVTSQTSAEPPSCTMVTVVAEVNQKDATLHIAWLGDSRAYWVAQGTAVQLTRDHSWALEQLELGELDPEVIQADSRAHSITRWLGADSRDVTPELNSLEVELPGLVVVCSDGLWNYAPTEAELHDVVMDGPAEESALERAERLVAFANAKGGHDNITVAIAELSERRQAPASEALADDPSGDDNDSDTELTSRNTDQTDEQE